MSDPMSTVNLQDCVADWHPSPVTAEEVLSATVANRLATTLDKAETFQDGDALPLLWQWVYFLDWPATAELGPDGHPLHGHFLPPIPNRRRMFAGGRVRIGRPLSLGVPTRRTSEVLATKVKQGRSGEMAFVTVRHSYRQGGEDVLVEEQDLVYRSDDGASTAFTRATERLSETAAPWSVRPHTHPALLFRYSALTGNAHRIHYDAQYTTGVEGFPALVVHGPLLATYMAELVREQAAGSVLSEFEFRLQKPVFVGDDIRVEGTPGEEIELAVVSGANTVHASAKARTATTAPSAS